MYTIVHQWLTSERNMSQQVFQCPVSSCVGLNSGVSWRTLPKFDRQNIPGWWYTYPSEKYGSQSAGPNWMESHKIPWFQSTNQYTSRTRKKQHFFVGFAEQKHHKKTWMCWKSGPQLVDVPLEKWSIQGWPSRIRLHDIPIIHTIWLWLT